MTHLKQTLAKTTEASKRLAEAVRQVNIDWTCAERADHGYLFVSKKACELGARSFWPSKPVAPEAWSQVAAQSSGRSDLSTFVASTAGLIDLYGGLNYPDLGTMTDDWSAIGRDFASVGDDMIAALRNDLAKRSQK